MSVEGSILASFTSDKGVEKNGKWHQIGPAKFLLARAGGSNVKFNKGLEAASKPYQRLIAAGQWSEEQAHELLVKVFVDNSLLDWENVRPAAKDSEGKWVAGEPIPYSKENATRIFNDHPDLFKMLFQLAQDQSAYAAEFADIAKGN